MGAGSFPAGIGPAGLDPVISSRPRDPIETPSALAFDGVAKDYQLDGLGRYVGVHWVDAAAFTQLRISEGSVRSAPGVGETISQIAYIDRRRIRAQVEDRVKLAWKQLIDGGFLNYLGVTLDLSTPGRIMYVADYENLVTKKRKQASPRTSTG